MKKIKLTATTNGPVKVEGRVSIKNSSGKIIKKTDETWLCRCGGSSNKPFCDGTHLKNNFSGCNNPGEEKSYTKAYVGKHITIYDNRGVCSHRGYCTAELPEVFSTSEPWINPNGDTAERIAAQCDKCPSGALSYALPNETRVKGENTNIKTIKLSEKHFGFHGPYDVKGNFTLDGQVTNEPESNLKATLCRCGHSKNKPYCSGEHYYVKFTDDDND